MKLVLVFLLPLINILIFFYIFQILLLKATIYKMVTVTVPVSNARYLLNCSNHISSFFVRTLKVVRLILYMSNYSQLREFLLKIKWFQMLCPKFLTLLVIENTIRLLEYLKRFHRGLLENYICFGIV